MKPPSLASKGGSATSWVSSISSISVCPTRSAMISASSSGKLSGGLPPIICASANPLRSAARSRGPPRSSAKRDKARSKSGTLFKLDCAAFLKAVFFTQYSTAFERQEIVSNTVDGDASRRASSRAPAAVTVLSIDSNNDPFLPPDNAPDSSRPRRVAASILTVFACLSCFGGQRSGNFPF